MIFAADAHLGHVGDSVMENGELPSRVADTFVRLNELLSAAQEDPDRLLVLGGDVFDSVDPKTYVVAGLLSCLAQHSDVEVCMIPGNHDCGVQWNSLLTLRAASLSHVRVVLKPHSFETRSGVVVSLFPHMPKRDTEALLLDRTVEEAAKSLLPRKSVLVVHGQLRGSIPASETEMESGSAYLWDLEKLSSFSLVLLGHVHRHQVHAARNGVEGVYSGPLVPQDFGEATDARGYIRVDEKSRWTFVPFSSKIREYRHIKIDLVSKESVDLSSKRIRKVARDKLLKITVYARNYLAVDMQEIRTAFEKHGRVLRYETLVFRGADEEITKELSPSAEHDLPTLLKQYLQKKSELDADTRRMAYRIGSEILEDVC